MPVYCKRYLGEASDETRREKKRGRAFTARIESERQISLLGAGWKGLTAAGRAEKELAENEVADGGNCGGVPPLSLLLSLLPSFFPTALRPILD